MLHLFYNNFQQKKSRGAAEFSWSIFNFQRDQDVRLKVGYELFEKVYLSSRDRYNTYASFFEVMRHIDVRYK